MARAGQRYERLVERRKRRLLGKLDGTVVEIGSGTGPNLRYVGRDVRWIGVEPNPWMDHYMRAEGERLARTVRLIRGSAERLPLADGSVDAVVSTLVLCSVDELDRALGEVLRVLRPGGRFVFIEHVAAPESTWLRTVQHWIRPAWRWAADGCRPDRNTARRITQAGFQGVEMERFRLPLPVVSPHVAGTAWKENGREEEPEPVLSPARPNPLSPRRNSRRPRPS